MDKKLRKGSGGKEKVDFRLRYLGNYRHCGVCAGVHCRQRGYLCGIPGSRLLGGFLCCSGAVYSGGIFAVRVRL